MHVFTSISTACTTVFIVSILIVFIHYTNIFIVYFKSFLTCLVCFISTNIDTSSLNSADVPLSNKQTKYCNMVTDGGDCVSARDSGELDVIYYDGSTYGGTILNGFHRGGSRPEVVVRNKHSDCDTHNPSSGTTVDGPSTFRTSLS